MLKDTWGKGKGAGLGVKYYICWCVKIIGCMWHNSILQRNYMQESTLHHTFFFFCSTGAWTQGLHLEPLHQPFMLGIFKIGSRRINCLGLASNRDPPDICLLSSSDYMVSHRCLAPYFF
jgi:hypothetical protein